jgi:hypothetical protein
MPVPVKSRRYRLIFWPLFSVLVVYMLANMGATEFSVATGVIIPVIAGLVVWAAIFIAQRSARRRANKSRYVTPIAQTDGITSDILNK